MLSRRDILGLSVTAALQTGLGTSRANADVATSSQLSIIDTNVSLFRWPFRRLPLDEPRSLIRKQAALGITQAWAGSFEGVLQRDITRVNQRLIDACGDRQQLVPIGSINLTLPDWQEDVRRCIEDHRMPGIRLYPSYHGYSLADVRFAKLLEHADEANCFVQLAVTLEDERTQIAAMRVAEVDLAPLPNLLDQYRRVRVQLLNYKPRSPMLDKLGRLPNLYFDTARLEGTDGVPNLVRELPPGRVMFGSHTPFLIPEAALIRLHEAGKLSAAELGELLRGNATEFLGQMPVRNTEPLLESDGSVPGQPGASPGGRASVRIVSPAEKAWANPGESASSKSINRVGLPATTELEGYRIWDAYFTPSVSRPGHDGYTQLIADIERSLPAIEKGAFQKLCYFPHVGIGTTTDTVFESLARSQPDVILEPLRRWPELLLGMIQLNAHRVPASLDALNRWLRDGPMVGVYFPGSGPGALCCTHENFHPLIERITQLGGVIMVHTWFKTGGKQGPGESTPAELAQLSARHPEQKFVCAHAGGEWEQGIRAVRSSPNILIETSGFDATAGFLEMAVAELGAERIVFGSHLPSRSLGTELAKVVGANITEDAKSKILGENLRRLLRAH